MTTNTQTLRHEWAKVNANKVHRQQKQVRRYSRLVLSSRVLVSPFLWPTCVLHATRNVSNL